MTDQSFIGSRIRERRVDQGIRQADLAAEIGISASYLNLIEHNKRRIGGNLLTKLASILDIAPDVLSAGADLVVLDNMRAAAARLNIDVEQDRAEELAIRLPGWANLIAAQNQRLSAMEKHVQALKDRMEHDPKLAAALHDLITSVTAIRATAGILLNEDRVDTDWQKRFHKNLHADSRRLTDQSKALVAYLDRAPDVAPIDPAKAPMEQAEHLLATTPDLIAAVNRSPSISSEELISAHAPTDLDPATAQALSARLDLLRADAEVLDIDSFFQAAVACEADPARLALDFDVPMPLLFRRLAYLPNDTRLPARGLLVCNAAGTMTHLKPVSGFAFNRQTGGCPRWPVFSALQQPGRPIRQLVHMPGAMVSRFMCYSIASAVEEPSFDALPLVESTMLIVADPPIDSEAETVASAYMDGCTCSYCQVRQ